jgi:FMN-dependent oxidoreductase (nitrilotriacetate monooxygenase family)
MGLPVQHDHDTRYELAEEYMQVVYKLWEGSWEDDAVRRDRAGGVYADPAKVHRVQHEGTHYRLDAIHLSEPSPQRTPVLYQAGSSARGREFAATHAECVFINGMDEANIRETVTDLRRRTAARGRDPRDLLVFLSRTTVVGRTAKEAREKYEEYHRHANVEAALAHFSSSSGIDFSRYEMDEPFRYEKTNAMNSAVDAITRQASTPWTKRRLIEQMGLGSRNAPIVGSGDEVAEALIRLVDETDIDGYNLSRTVSPESLEDFVALVVPALQERGAFKHGYEDGPLRQKLFGAPRLPASHPAAGYRPVTAVQRTAAE